MDNGASSYRRFLSGDEGAFEEIVKDYRDSLTFFINSIVHDAAAAEDIAIDVFTYLVVHPERYNQKTSLKTYLFMLGRSRAIDHLRRRLRQKETAIDEVQQLADSTCLEEAVLADERSRAVNRALGELPDDMHTAVHLIYFEQLSYREAAAVMKKSTKQVDNLVYRAKARLRTALEREGELLL